MIPRVPLIAVMLLAAQVGRGQPAPLPQFEVAEVKPNKSGGDHTSSHSTNGRYTSSNMSLRDYIRIAYQVKDGQIAGPAWMATERFDIVAKAPEKVPFSQLALMMQALLVD